MRTATVKDIDDWLNVLNREFPGSKQRIIAAALQGDGMGQETADVPWWEKISNVAGSIGDAAAKILPAYQNYRMQDAIIDQQIDRAKTGLPPVDASLYVAPPIRVEVGPALPVSISPQVKQWMWIGGAAGIGLLLWRAFS